jgi:hypothetical protein
MDLQKENQNVQRFQPLHRPTTFSAAYLIKMWYKKFKKALCIAKKEIRKENKVAIGKIEK